MLYNDIWLQQGGKHFFCLLSSWIRLQKVHLANNLILMLTHFVKRNINKTILQKDDIRVWLHSISGKNMIKSHNHDTCSCQKVELMEYILLNSSLFHCMP